MHALCKTLFFTTGSVGLLILVFLWTALKYGLIKLNFLTVSILNYKFSGFYLADFLLVSSTLDPGQEIYFLKILFTGCIAIGSIFLIIISYLPRLSWQLRSLSLVISIFLFTLLTLFWICLKNGSEVIKTSEKSVIFSFTAITYLLGVFLLWYAMRAKSTRRTKNKNQKANEKEPVEQVTVAPKKINDSGEENSVSKNSTADESNPDQESSTDSPDGLDSEKPGDQSSEKLPEQDDNPEQTSVENEEKIEALGESDSIDMPEENDTIEEVVEAETSSDKEVVESEATQLQEDEQTNIQADENMVDGEAVESPSTEEAKVT